MSFRITITNGPDQVYICKSNHDKTSVKRWRAKKYCPEFLKTSICKKCFFYLKKRKPNVKK